MVTGQVSANLDSQLFQSALIGHLFGRPPPPLIGRYEVHARVAEGGGGRVYRGYDPKLARAVAIKLPKTEPLTTARLRNEAQALAQFHHPGVVEVYDVVDSAWGLAVILPWTDGGTLRRWQADPSRTARDVIEAYVAAGRGLTAVHALGLVHRDFKPDNVLMTDDGPKVCDFGLARTPTSLPLDTHLQARHEAPGITEHGSTPGTPGFMSPEQEVGIASAKGDQYSWCRSLEGALDELQPTADPNGLREGLEAVLQRGLHQEPERRHPSLKHLLDEVEQTTLRPSRRTPRRVLPYVAAGLGSFAVVVVAQTQTQAQTDAPSSLTLEPLIAAPESPLDPVVSEALLGYERARNHELDIEQAIDGLENAYRLAAAESAFETEARLALRLSMAERSRQDAAAAHRWTLAAEQAVQRGGLEQTSVQAGVWSSFAAGAFARRDAEPAEAYSVRAVALLDALSDPDPREYAAALYTFANTQTVLEKFESALEHLSKARRVLESAGAEEAVEYATVLVSQADVLGVLKRYTEEVAVAQRILETCPETLGRCLKPRQRALLHLAQATALDNPDRFDAFCDAALQLAERDAALSESSAMSIRPQIFRLRAIRLAQEGKLAEAEREFSIAIDESLAHHRTYFPSLVQSRAMIRLSQNKFAEARADAMDLARFGGPQDQVSSEDLLAEISERESEHDPS